MYDRMHAKTKELECIPDIDICTRYRNNYANVFQYRSHRLQTDEPQLVSKTVYFDDTTNKFDHQKAKKKRKF